MQFEVHRVGAPAIRLACLMALSLGLNGCGSPPAPGPIVTPDQSISAAELINVIRSEDIGDITMAINRAKASARQDSDLLRVAEALWRYDAKALPDVNLSIARDDRVRVEIADFLAQAKINRRTDMDVEPIHKYALDKVPSRDLDVAMTAVSILGVLDRPGDVPTLVAIAQDVDRRLFRSAVGALDSMCAVEAEAALVDLSLKDLGRVENETVREAIARAKSFKESGWCDRLSDGTP